MRAPLVFLAVALAGLGALAWVAASGWDYFSLPAQERPLHPSHALLRPSGRAGLWFGAGGLLLVLVNLAYLLRNRLTVLRLRARRSRVAFHVASGLLGAGLAALHTAFLPQSRAGVLAAGAMAAVVATGIAGRGLYALLQRSARVRALFATWRALHRWLAVLLLFLVLLHVALALRYGDLGGPS